MVGGGRGMGSGRVSVCVIRGEIFRVKCAIGHFFTIDPFTIDHFTIDHFTIDHFTIEYFTIGHFTIGHFTIDPFTIEYLTIGHFTMGHGAEAAAGGVSCWQRGRG